MAASVTVRAIGPGVSWSAVIGITPQRLIRPTVGFTPASMFAFDRESTEPDVSVPTFAAQKLAAVPIPELEPRLFSFNAPQGACAQCNGLGALERFDVRWSDASSPARVVENVASRSYVIQLPDPARAAVLAEVAELLATHPDTAGREALAVPYVTTAWRADLA